MAHSIAQYTGTRIDSSAKHIVACKVNHDLFTRLGNNEKELTEDKYRFAMQKDEMVLNVGQMTKDDVVLGGDRSFKRTYVKHAYPSVVTTLGNKLKDEQKNGIRLYYRTLQFNTEDDGIVYETNDTGVVTQRFFPFKFDFVGVSVGTAYASDLTGDPVGSVMIGGMATVLNGHFPCYTGELVQWYFDFEAEEYDQEGRRREPAVLDNRTRFPVSGREAWYQQRMFAAYKENDNGKRNVALIKPLRKNAEVIESVPYGDKVRVIGRIVNGGQPWEPIDIFLCNVFV